MKQLVNFHARKTEFFRSYHSSNSDAIDAQKNGSALEGTWPFKKQPPIKLVL